MGEGSNGETPPETDQTADVSDSAARIIGADEEQPHSRLPPARYDYPNPMLGFLSLLWRPRDRSDDPPPRPPTPTEARENRRYRAMVVGGIVAVAILWLITQL